MASVRDVREGEPARRQAADRGSPDKVADDGAVSETGVLAVLLALAAILYAVTWAVVGPPNLPRSDPAAIGKSVTGDFLP